MQITDRAKDVIKSGGEWISSIDLENLAVGHPEVAEAAVIGIAHPKWDERPLLVVVPKPGARARHASRILAYMEGKIAKWWMPDDVVFVRRNPAHGDRQDPEDGAAGPVQGLPVADGSVAQRPADRRRPAKVSVKPGMRRLVVELPALACRPVEPPAGAVRAGRVAIAVVLSWLERIDLAARWRCSAPGC